MIGVVTPALDLTFRIRLRTSDEVEIGEVDATLDTGFTEFLLLPQDLIEPLGLTVQEESMIGLGDGSSALMEVVRLDVEWLGRWRTIPVYVAPTDPLIGVSLLEGHRLTADFTPGGDVRIEVL